MREQLASFYSHTGRPAIDPNPMLRMLLLGYCFGIRSERRHRMSLALIARGSGAMLPPALPTALRTPAACRRWTGALAPSM
jgi:Transposase domain (DUF772)